MLKQIIRRRRRQVPRVIDVRTEPRPAPMPRIRYYG
jgi:hypothetical protein